MEPLTPPQLKQRLLQPVWILKDLVGTSDFEVYLFPILMFKYISDVYDGL